MKRVLTALLGILMVFAGISASAESTFAPAAAYDPGERLFDGGEIALAMAEAESGGQVTQDVYAGEAGKDYTDIKFYTYNTSLTTMRSGLDWNPHTWETGEDSIISVLINSGIYEFKLNTGKDGYSVVPEMAAAMPMDVTGEYAGSYGIAQGEDAKAWRIALNPEAVWDNGEKITADDYIYSMQQILNPKMLNRRADSVSEGNFSIINARNYLYAGRIAYTKLGEASAAAMLEAGKDVFVDMYGFWNLKGAVDDQGNEVPQYVSISDEVLYRDASVEDETAAEAWVSARYFYDAYLAQGQRYAGFAGEFLATSDIVEGAAWDEVGLKKVDEYTIDIILEKRVAEASFYIPYHLTNNWLVYKPLYEAGKKFQDALGAEAATEEEAVRVLTDYCTTLENSIGYGPYKLTDFQPDRQFTLERNDTWYGYKDGRHLGQYQTDRIVYTVIPEQAAQLQSFLAGALDYADLVPSDMEAFALSPNLRFEPWSSTTKISFNTLYEKLLERSTNSQVVVVDEFRKAFAFAINREEFAAAYTAAGSVGYGLLNYAYTYNPFTGALYRDSAPAKEALVSLYGLRYGEGADYATLDEAYDAMTGYNMAAARALMATAYDKAVASGIYDGSGDVVLEFRVDNGDTTYVQMLSYLDSKIKEAAGGSGFEGKLSIKMTVDPDHYQTMYLGGADMIFTDWGGAEMSPFTFMALVYTDAADGSGNQMEVGFDTGRINMTIKVDGDEVTDSLRNWTRWANNADIGILDARVGKFADLSYETRCAFVARMEMCFLSYFTAIPVYYGNGAYMESQKVNSAGDTFLQLVSFGGMPFLTYSYDDAEWTEYIAAGTFGY